ncbi:MAG TPA: XisI protein [Bacteroidetes bacterium]|nr:XisI protein [Bacteroidota bacterium]
MEKIKKYETAIIDFLKEYAAGYQQDKNDPVRTEVVTDSLNHHYQLLRVGWKDRKFHHYCIFHFDIIDGKIWVQANNTEEMVGDELTKRGVPRQDIILGFQPEYTREHSGFGVA